MARLSAFADEAAQEFTAQVDFLSRENIGHLERRRSTQVGGVDSSDLSIRP